MTITKTNFSDNTISATPNTREVQTTMTTTIDNLIDSIGLEVYYDLTAEDVKILCASTREILAHLVESGQIEWGANDYLEYDTFPLPVQDKPQELWRLSEVKAWYAEKLRQRAFDFFYDTFYNSYLNGDWYADTDWYSDCDFDSTENDDTAVETLLQCLFEGAEDIWGLDDRLKEKAVETEKQQTVTAQQEMEKQIETMKTELIGLKRERDHYRQLVRNQLLKTMTQNQP